MRRHTPASTLVAFGVVLAASAALAQPTPIQAAGAQSQPAQVQAPGSNAQPSPQSELPGVRNFTKVDATLACGGAIKPESFADIKKAGFASVVNLRAATEEGANVEAEQKAAEAAGLVYIHLPFTTSAPDASKVDAFLAAYATPSNQPMLLHCASGGRASVFWAIKRVMVDGWPLDKAMAELPDLAKNTSEALRKFAQDYVKAHAK